MHRCTRQGTVFGADFGVEMYAGVETVDMVGDGVVDAEVCGVVWVGFLLGFAHSLAAVYARFASESAASSGSAVPVAVDVSQKKSRATREDSDPGVHRSHLP
jgi:hypothetical protein